VSDDPLLEFARSAAVLMLTSGDNIYLGRARVAEALEWLHAQGLVVLGMEGFSTDGRYVLPSLDHVADFSEIDGTWPERVAASHQAAITVISLWDDAVPFVQIETESVGPG
jgi:hypothetical protein